MKLEVKLRESGLWGFIYFVRGLLINEMQLGETAEYMFANINSNNLVQVRFPSWRGWRKDPVTDKMAISLYFEELGVVPYLNLGKNTSIFQAEALGIFDAWNILAKRCAHNIVMYIVKIGPGEIWPAQNEFFVVVS